MTAALSQHVRSFRNTLSLCRWILILSHLPFLHSFSTPKPITIPPTTPEPLYKTPIVICPGFGNDPIDYITPLEQERSVGLVAQLEKRGFDPERIAIVPLSRWEWARVAGGLLDIPNFYTKSALPTGKGYGWYVKRVKETVDQVYESSGGEKVIVIGHSAGGWLARAALGDGTWEVLSDGEERKEIRTSDRIACLATVGAIHKPPKEEGTCVTAGALANTNSMFPGAFLKDEGVGYVSVGGDAIVGDDSKENLSTEDGATDADDLYAKRGESSASRVAYTSYKAVCGEGDVTGDGVVPLEWSMLENARQIPLEGVLHSINEAGTTIPTDRWYGSDKIIDSWLPAVLEEAGIAQSGGSKKKSNFFDTVNYAFRELIGGS